MGESGGNRFASLIYPVLGDVAYWHFCGVGGGAGEAQGVFHDPVRRNSSGPWPVLELSNASVAVAPRLQAGPINPPLEKKLRYSMATRK